MMYSIVKVLSSFRITSSSCQGISQRLKPRLLKIRLTGLPGFGLTFICFWVNNPFIPASSVESFAFLFREDYTEIPSSGFSSFLTPIRSSFRPRCVVCRALVFLSSGDGSESMKNGGLVIIRSYFCSGVWKYDPAGRPPADGVYRSMGFS